MNKKNKIKAVIAFAVALAFLAPGSAVFANDEGTFADNTIVSIDPATLPVEKDMSFTVDVYVVPGDVTGDPEGITGVQCDLYFDQTLIRADLVTEGDIFSGYSTWFGPGTIDNVNGKIDDIYNTILDDAAHSDPGVFVTISFTSLDKLGTSLLDLDEVIVIDYDGDPVIVDVNDGSVTVEEFFDLTIGVDGNGATLPMAGVHSYASGAVVDLTATADDGWTFDHWDGDVADPLLAITTITMNDDEAVTAYFTWDEYTLTVTPDGNGHVDVDPLETFYRYGDEPLLTAVADPGWSFDHWSVDLTGDTNPTTIFMDDDKTVTATFTEDWYDLTITIDGEGTVDVNPAGPYRYNDEVTLIPHPDENWMLDAWGGPDGDLVVDNKILMTKSMEVTAIFKNQWDVTLSISGTVSFAITDTVVFGEKALANEGKDKYDVTKCPTPPNPPYVYAWFNTSIAAPYDILWEDYRLLKAENTWNFKILTDGNLGRVKIIIEWSTDDVATSGYDYVELYDMLTGHCVVHDMEGVNYYEYWADNGMDYWFQIRVSMNHPPVANDDYYTTNENTVLVVDAPGLLLNDIDPDGNDLEVTHRITSPSHGHLSLWHEGKFVYTPVIGYTGPDEFEYEITDGFTTDTAKVYIEVISLNCISIKDGWNLFSIPIGEDIDKTTIIVEYGGTWHTWDEAISDHIILGFTYGWQAGGYTDGKGNTLEPGEGYWMWAYEDCDLLIPSNAETDNHITYLDVGWNLVGVHEEDLLKTKLRLQYDGQYRLWTYAVTNGVILDFVYDWDRDNQNYALALDDIFVSGYGYWVYAYQGCALKEPL